MQNSVEQINILKKQLDEQISLWESQTNKNSAESDKIKSDIEKTAIEIKLKTKSFKLLIHILRWLKMKVVSEYKLVKVLGVIILLILSKVISMVYLKKLISG